MPKTLQGICYILWTSRIIRILFAALFIWSGVYKLLNLREFGDIVVGYSNLVTTIEQAVFLKRAVPIIEIALGIAWLFAPWKYLVWTTALLNAGFIFGIAVHWGETLNCGCLPGSEPEVVGALSFRKNALIMLAIIAFAIVNKRYIAQRRLSNL